MVLQPAELLKGVCARSRACRRKRPDQWRVSMPWKAPERQEAPHMGASFTLAQSSARRKVASPPHGWLLHPMGYRQLAGVAVGPGS